MTKTSPEEIIHVLSSVIQNNYSMSREDVREVMQSMFAYQSNTKIILLAENKMRKHVEGMLKTHSLEEVMEFYR